MAETHIPVQYGDDQRPSPEQEPHSEIIHVPLNERLPQTPDEERVHSVLQEFGGDVEALARAYVGLQDENEKLAHNSTSGLEGEHRMLDHLSTKLHEAAAKGGTVGVAFLDIDGLKRLNEVFGHPKTNKLLGVVGATLLERSRQSEQTTDGVPREKDKVFHPHGDEFVAVLSDHKLENEERLEALAEQDEEDIQKALRKAMANMEKEIPVDDEDIHVGITVGIVVSDGHETADEALTRASVQCRQRKDRKAEHDPRYREVHDPSTSTQGGFITMIVVLVLMVLAMIALVFMRVVNAR